MDADLELLGLVADQHGFATRQGARSLGLTGGALAHRLAGPEWEVHGRRVIRRAGAPCTKASPLMRAVLDAGPGAVLSHGTAAAWWGLPGFDLRTIHVTRPSGLTSAQVTYADVLHAVLDLSTSWRDTGLARGNRPIRSRFGTAVGPGRLRCATISS